MWDRGRIAPTLSLGWGLAWIAVARLTDAPASTVVGVTAIIAVVAVVLVTVAVRVAVELRRRHQTAKAPSSR